MQSAPRRGWECEGDGRWERGLGGGEEVQGSIRGGPEPLHGLLTEGEAEGVCVCVVPVGGKEVVLVSMGFDLRVSSCVGWEGRVGFLYRVGVHVSLSSPTSYSNTHTHTHKAVT